MKSIRRTVHRAGCAASLVALVAAVLLVAPAPVGAARPTDAGGFVAVPSKRVFDSLSLKDGPCLGPTSPRSITVASNAGVPDDAAAVAVNITVVRPTESGYLTAFPAGVPRPTSSNINFVAGSVVPNSAIVKVGTKGQITIFVSAGCAHVLVDVTGYFTTGQAKGNGAFVGMTPQRALDTRTTGGCVAGGTTRTTLVGGSFGVPANAVAVAANITAVLPTGPGYLVAFPGGTATPTASTLNFTAGQVIANATSVKLGAGKLSLFSGVTSPCVHVVVDIVGYYLPGNAATTAVAPGGFGALPPQRVFDSRSFAFGAACIPGGTTRDITVTSVSGDTPNAVALNLTVTAPTASAYITVFEAGTSRPGTSNLNVVAGQTVANGALVRPSSTGKVSIFVSAGCAQVIVDRVGLHTKGNNSASLTGTPTGAVAGQTGDRDGTAASARVPGASWIARNPATGDLYVTETALHTVRKITAAGTVTTLAGSAGLPGSTNGTGAAARFNAPSGIALLPGGDLLVADANNATIRRITPAGVVTTVAGSVGVRGGANGSGTSATFNYPVGLAVRADGQVLVTDAAAQTIRKIDTANAVTTVAGAVGIPGTANGPAASSRFSSPTGIAVMPDGRVAVADTGNNLIRMLSSDLTTVSTYAGTSSLGDLTGAGGSRDGDGVTNVLFNQPAGLAASSAGELFVADRFGRGIRRISTAQVVSTVSGTLNTPDFVDGTGAAGRFRQPVGLATDGAGSFWIGDQGNSAVRVLSPGFVLSTLVGKPSTAGATDGLVASSELRAPGAATADANGTVYIADAGNCTIRKSVGGTVSTLAGTAGACGIADGTGASARFNAPRGITIGLDGNIYVADSLNHSIRKVTPAGAVTTLAGANNSASLSFIVPAPGFADGSTGDVARFNEPSGIAVTPAGLLMVADTGNHSIRTVNTTTGATSTYSGNGLPGSTSLSFPQYRFPVAVAVDAVGAVFVADRDNGVVRVIDPVSLFTTSLASGSDPLVSQDFSSPQGVAVDTRGLVYVTSANRMSVARWATGLGASDFIGRQSINVPGLPVGIASAVLPTFLPQSPATVARTALATQFVDPGQITFGDDGRLYVADRGGNSVVRAS